jgi:hypothetical protein
MTYTQATYVTPFYEQKAEFFTTPSMYSWLRISAAMAFAGPRNFSVAKAGLISPFETTKGNA